MSFAGTILGMRPGIGRALDEGCFGPALLLLNASCTRTGLGLRESPRTSRIGNPELSPAPRGLADGQEMAFCWPSMSIILEVLFSSIGESREFLRIVEEVEDLFHAPLCCPFPERSFAEPWSAACFGVLVALRSPTSTTLSTD